MHDTRRGGFRKSNPSSWRHRLPIAGAIVCGMAISLYLALYQWGILEHVWDPFFRDPSGMYPSGSSRVLHSWLSQRLPVPDAFIGFVAYTAELVLELIGDQHRWRTRPGIVLLFGLLVLLMAAGGIGLVLIQAFSVRAWCFLCVCSAAISLCVVAPAMDEVREAARYVRARHHAGTSLWKTLGLGSGSGPLHL